MHHLHYVTDGLVFGETEEGVEIHGASLQGNAPRFRGGAWHSEIKMKGGAHESSGEIVNAT